MQTRFSVTTAHRNTAFLMLAEFVLKLSLEPLLPETSAGRLSRSSTRFRPRPKRSWRKHEFLGRNCQERKR